MRIPTQNKPPPGASNDLERLELQLWGILGTVPVNLIIIDQTGEVLAFGSAAEQIFGYRAIDIVGKNVSLLMPEPHRSRHNQYISNYLKTHQPKAIGRGRLVRGQRANGSIVPVELHIGKTDVLGRNLFIAYTRNASTPPSTQRLADKIDTELENFTRLSAVGSMAGGMAHELNQPLNVISNYIDIAVGLLGEQSQANTDDIHNVLCRARSQVFRAAGIVQKIRNYVATGTMDIHPVKLNKIIMDAVSSARLSFGHQAPGIRLRHAPDSTMVMADPLQISQVLLNLMNNAREALAETENPIITVTSEIIEPDTVRIKVSDNGPGIVPDLQSSLFNAFVSTKPHGMGMGLSIAHAILYGHDKSIRLVPDTETGATIEFFLDLADPEEVT